MYWIDVWVRTCSIALGVKCRIPRTLLQDGSARQGERGKLARSDQAALVGTGRDGKSLYQIVQKVALLEMGHS